MTVVFPGSFDPVTIGHIDLLKRAAEIFDRIVVVVVPNDSKNPSFSVEERIRFLKASLADMPCVEVDQYSGLIVNYMRDKGYRVLIRGLRDNVDFAFESRMAQYNQMLFKGVDTVFLPTRLEYALFSSSAVREIAKNGGDISAFVPRVVHDEIKRRLNGREDLI
jgi:pantetheine-phosphate adenylyltransferase